MSKVLASLISNIRVGIYSKKKFINVNYSTLIIKILWCLLDLNFICGFRILKILILSFVRSKYLIKNSALVFRLIWFYLYI